MINSKGEGNAMGRSKDLRKLSRADLLELLVDMSRENDRLKEELESVQQRLGSRELKMKEAGTMAEAALALNGVFEAADAACSEYLENIKARFVADGAQDKQTQVFDEDKVKRNLSCISCYGEVDVAERPDEIHDIIAVEAEVERILAAAQEEAERIEEEAKGNAQKALNRARKKARKIVAAAKEDAEIIRQEAHKELRRAKKKNK